jgi:hypothetical protein
MDAEELEDYLEVRDPKVQAHIRASYAEYLAGKARPADELLSELKRGKASKRSRKKG